MGSSPAERQVVANEQVETLARELHGIEKAMIEEGRSSIPGGYVRPNWAMISEDRRAFFREFARRALVRDLVRPGKALPEPAPRQIEGQEALKL